MPVSADFTPSWCPQLDDAIGKVTGTSLVLSAHIYPGNWSSTFQEQIDRAATEFPVFVSEWGYGTDDPSDSVGSASSPSWGVELRDYLDGKGVSWTGWVTDDAWTPRVFLSVASRSLTLFGTLVKDWLVATADSDWVE